MPHEYTVDRERRVVISTWEGVVTDAELFAYQETLWSDAALAGFDELIDLRNVERLEATGDSMRRLARMAAGMNHREHHPKTAVVAGKPAVYGMVRMYETLREMQPEGRRDVRAFDDIEAAKQWLGLEEG